MIVDRFLNHSIMSISLLSTCLVVACKAKDATKSPQNQERPTDRVSTVLPIGAAPELGIVGYPDIAGSWVDNAKNTIKMTTSGSKITFVLNGSGSSSGVFKSQTQISGFNLVGTIDPSSTTIGWSNGKSIWTKVVVSGPPAAPPAPLSLTFSNESSSGASTGWTSGGGTTTGFTVNIQAGNSPGLVCTGGTDAGNVLTFAVSSLTANTLYTAAVCAYNSSHVTSASVVKTFTTLADNVVCKPGACSGIGPMARCQIVLQSCPKQPSYSLTTFDDNYKDSSTNLATCMQRASEFKGWCGARQEVTARGLDANYKTIQVKTLPADAGYSNIQVSRCEVRVPSCPNQAATYPSGVYLDDVYNKSNLDLNLCMMRADDYKDMCGTPYSASSTAYDQNGKAVASNQTPGQDPPPAIPPVAPPAPLSLTFSNVSSSGASASWTSGGGTTTGFTVNIQAGNSPGLVCAGGTDAGNVLTFAVSSLSANTLYTAAVCAYNASRVTSASVVKTFTTLADNGGCKPGACPGIGPMARCQIVLQSCPKQPSYSLTTFDDNYKDSSTNVATCMQRASEFKGWCGTRQEVTARGLDANYKTIQVKTLPVDAGYSNIQVSRCEVHVPSCPNQAATYPSGVYLDDAYNKSNLDLNLCMMRADDYKDMCGTPYSASATAYDQNGNAVASNQTPGQDPFDHCAVSAETCPLQNNWGHLVVARDDTAKSMSACLDRLTSFRTLCGPGPLIRVKAYDFNGKFFREKSSDGYLNSPDLPGGPVVGAGKDDGSNPIPPAASFSVESYGAVADGKTDSTAAFQKAVDAAAASKASPAEIVLAAGTYFLACKSFNENQCLSFTNVRQLTFKGQGPDRSKVLIGNPRAGFIGVTGSDNIYLMNFSLDYTVAPSFQGTIKKIGSGYFDVLLSDGFPSPNDSSVFTANSTKDSFGMAFSPSDLRVKAPNYLGGIKFPLSQNSDGTYRIPTLYTSGFSSGDLYAYALRGTGGSGFIFHSSSNLSLVNVTLYAAPLATSTWTFISGKVVVNNFQVRRAPGRVLTTAADAIWTVDCSAKFLVENSYFEGMGDDAINFHSSGRPISQISSSTQLKIVTEDNSLLPVPGEFVQMSGGTGSVKAMATIGSTQPGKPFGITLNSPVSNVSTGDYLFDVQLSAPTSLIVNNIYGTYRGMSRVRGVGTIVQGNQYANQENANFYTHVDVSSGWQEGPELLSGTWMMPHFIGNTVAGGGSVLLYSANMSSVSAAPQ
jgi:Pectate lyase superfamily protein/Fibronectin type III domain